MIVKVAGKENENGQKKLQSTIWTKKAPKERKERERETTKCRAHRGSSDMQVWNEAEIGADSDGHLISGITLFRYLIACHYLII